MNMTKATVNIAVFALLAAFTNIASAQPSEDSMDTMQEMDSGAADMMQETESTEGDTYNTDYNDCYSKADAAVADLAEEQREQQWPEIFDECMKARGYVAEPSDEAGETPSEEKSSDSEF